MEANKQQLAELTRWIILKSGFSFWVPFLVSLSTLRDSTLFACLSISFETIYMKYRGWRQVAARNQTTHAPLKAPIKVTIGRYNNDWTDDLGVRVMEMMVFYLDSL